MERTAFEAPPRVGHAFTTPEAGALVFTYIFLTSVVLVLNEMVLVLLIDSLVAIEHEHEHRHPTEHEHEIKNKSRE